MSTGTGLPFRDVGTRQRTAYYPAVGEFLKSVREARGWKRAEAANRAHRRGLTLITLNKLNAWEFGKTRRLDRPFLDQLAVLYGEPDLFETVAKKVYGPDPLSQTSVGTLNSTPQHPDEGFEHEREHQARLLERLDGLLRAVGNANEAITLIGKHVRSLRGDVKSLGKPRSARRDPA